MRIPKFKKKFIAGALAAGLVMGAGGIAAAYFTAGGSGTGHAVVGTSTAFTATYKSVSPATFGPGSTQTVTLTLHNPGTGTQHYAIATADYSLKVTGTTVKNDNASTAKATGCKSAWFTFKTGTASGTLAAGATVTITVKMSMSTTGTQSPCKTVQPSFRLTFAA